jgi:transcriptional regulator with XRE-family HTH domain
MSNARPGTALKRLRKANHWTLADVTKKTGIPPSTLSRIENDQISPTYDLLVKLSKGLSIDLSQLLSMESANLPETSDQRPGRRSVNRKDDGETVEMLNHTLRYLSNDLLKKQITPILCEYRSRSIEEFGPLMRHEGEEFLYVIDGELELHTEYYAPLILKPGESTYFDSRMGHAYVSRGAKPCHALSICTAPDPVEMRQSAAATANGGRPPAIVPLEGEAASPLEARIARTRRRARRSA